MLALPSTYSNFAPAILDNDLKRQACPNWIFDLGRHRIQDCQNPNTRHIVEVGIELKADKGLNNMRRVFTMRDVTLFSE